MPGFKWSKKKSAVALALAEGQTQQQIARSQSINDRTIRRWLADIEFSAEVDRLSLMVSVASRAERLRIASRVARQQVRESGLVMTTKDILDWLKFAQSETEGIKLELAALAAAQAPAAGGGSD